MDESKIENINTTGARSPLLWTGVSFIFITLAGVISPSIIALMFVCK